MKKIHPTLLVVSLIIAAAFPACKKAANTGPTAGMTGVRNWHRHHYLSASGVHYATPVSENYFLTDTVFTVTIAADGSVSMFGNLYNFQSVDTAKKVRYFGDAYYYYTYGSGTGVAYFYVKDSIVWCNGDTHATSDFWKLEDLCYTY